MSAEPTAPAKPAAAVHLPSEEPAHPDEPHLRATPLVRALARENGIDLTTVTGTGPGGRIVRADIDALIAQKSRAATGSTGVLVPTRGGPTPGLDGDERVPLTSIRRVTAQRLTESAAVPHFHLTAVAEVGALEALRAELNTDRPAGAPKISVTDLLIRACAVTLPGHLDLNSSWGGDHLVRHHRVNIGCAVAVDAGLVVPVIADANHRSLTDIATAARELVDRARAGRLSPAELSGGTFTISNLGMYDIESFTAVINPPEAAILAVGTVVDQAVVRDGQFAAARRLTLTLTVDHRVADGATAATFLQDLVRLLEHPVRILI